METTAAEVLDKTLAQLRAQTTLRHEDLDDGRLLGRQDRRRRSRTAALRTPPPDRLQPLLGLRHRQPPRIQVMDHVVNQALDDGEALDLTHTPDRGTLTRHIPRRTRRTVLARDVYCCVFPGCACDLFRDLHHLQPFARGGDHSEQNLVTVCTARHAAAHQGHVGLFLNDQNRLMAVHQGGLIEPARVGGRGQAAA